MTITQIWFLIIFGFVFLAVILFFLIKKGGKIETKYGAIIIPESGRNKTKESTELFKYLFLKLGEIREKKFNWFLQELKKKGTKEEYLLSNNDAMFSKYSLQRKRDFINKINS
jgi:cbb3-type cytochrome oxidase subunit 3